MSQPAPAPASGSVADSLASVSRVRWPIVTLLMALCFISHMNRISMAVAGDQRIMKQFSIAPTEMGKIYSAFLLVYTVFMIPGGFFIDRFGPRAALMVVGFGSALFGAFTGGVGFALTTGSQVWLSLVIIRGLMALPTTPLHPACARAVGMWTPPAKRSLINGLVTGAALLGIACTYKAFGSLIEWLDWPAAFVVTAAATALLAALWGWIARSQPAVAVEAPARPADSTTDSSSWWKLLSNRSLILLTMSYGAIGYFQYLFFYWMHYYFDDVLHLGKSASEFYAGIPPLVMAVGMPLGGWLTDRLQRSMGMHRGRAAMPILGMTAGAILLGLGILAKQPAWIVAWFSLALGAVGAAEGAFWSTAVELGGCQGGAAAAIMNTGGNGGGMLAPYLTPLVSAKWGWPWGLGLGGLVCLIGALCWLRIHPAEHRRERPIEPR
jgi:ACS family D-galactonate transporter-like MFS transporter